MNPKQKLGLAAGAVITIGAVALGGSAIASDSGADSGSSGAPSGSARTSEGRPAPHSHTAASASETTKVKAAVKAKDSAITVTSVEKDPDGSFDAHGTKAGAEVKVDVSKDLKTVEVREGGPGGRGGHDGDRDGKGGPGGPGAHEHKAVTGTALAKVKAAVKAKDSAVTISEVRQDPDGSYDVMGTKSGDRVMVEVSKDLATVTVR